MSKEEIQFQDFLHEIGSGHLPFVLQLHERMLARNCGFSIKQAKNGQVLSYVHTPSKRSIANYVFRKRGPMLRIYAQHIASYAHILEAWPQEMKASVAKASACKRLLDPAACSPSCPMGYAFTMGGEAYQKCRYNCFFFALSEETNPFLMELMEEEVAARYTY